MAVRRPRSRPAPPDADEFTVPTSLGDDEALGTGEADDAIARLMASLPPLGDDDPFDTTVGTDDSWSEGLGDDPHAPQDRLHDADGPEDADVFALVDEELSSWTTAEDESTTDAHEALDALPDHGGDADDGGALGFDDAIEALPDPLESVDELAEDAPSIDGVSGWFAEESLPAFDLAPATGTALVRLVGDRAIFTMIADESTLIVAGEGCGRIDVAALDPGDGMTHPTRLEPLPRDEVIASVQHLPAQGLVAATVDGAILASGDDGRTWEPSGTLAGDDGTPALVELYSVVQGARSALWARAHGGSLFRSHDGGARWEGPLLEHPVRLGACDRAGRFVAVTASVPHVVQRIGLEGGWERLPIALPAAPVALAAHGDVLVVACEKGAGIVSVDGGRSTVAWPLLAGATALALALADDGAVELVAAIHDPSTERTTIVTALLADDGRPRHPRRIAELDATGLAPDLHAMPEDGETVVEAIEPIGPAGRRLAVMTAGGVVIVLRDAVE